MISGETVSVGAGEKAVSNAINLVQAPSSPGEYPRIRRLRNQLILSPKKTQKKPNQNQSPLKRFNPNKLKIIRQQK